MKIRIIKHLFTVFFCFTSFLVFSQEYNEYLDRDSKGSLKLNVKGASHFAKLALTCIQKEYPNKLNQVLGGDIDLGRPSELHPVFYGCFDWHSSVHGHWMLVRLMKMFPSLPEAKEIRRKLNQNITEKNIGAEIVYFNGKHNKSFERTYGWAWLLKLAEELYTWDDPDAKKWSERMQPLTTLIANKFQNFLPKLNYAIRNGEHPNTAFSMALAWDYAKTVNNQKLMNLIAERSKYYYLKDKNCPTEWEPGGFDFLSPCLSETDIMRRILPNGSFQEWLHKFLPNLAKKRPKIPFKPAVVTDRTDGKFVHLDGLNLSRAWCLYGIASVFKGKKREIILNSANHHILTTLPNIASGDYAGEHWLASFAVYALTVKGD
ncbi:DUF2891 domain-containing protein [Fulvivirgaceae bacterium BMA10]|uniref:DUF2891 domain-containing protein n=1 Tax=Splendidivirga corallicola TaxID=3051826 RepID=A0ABT8KVM9_9BACT|nr:DUF2891 domain-containing protein [Fulvivirgaceae bacterium BMA10]